VKVIKTTNTYSLFDNNIDSDSVGLSISKSNNKVLSKEQIQFNKLSKRIENIRKQIESTQVKLDTLFSYYSEKMPPQYEKYGNGLTAFVMQLNEMHKYLKFTNTKREKLETLILNNLEKAFVHIMPTDEVKAIYDKFSETSFDEELKKQEGQLKDSMSDMFSKMFGKKVDFSDMDMSEEAIAKKMAEMQDVFEQVEQNVGDFKTKKRKQTVSQLKQEEKKKQIEELQNKNFRLIYTSLAKMLHPDLEIDETLKNEKEELMKKVTNAYNDKDLHTLLKLEIEIIHKENENLERLTDDKLKLLNSALKEQVNELNHELSMVTHHPKYEPISEYVFYAEKTAIQKINKEYKEIVEEETYINEDIEKLKSSKGEKFLNELLNSVYHENSNGNMNLDDISTVDALKELMTMMKQQNSPY